MQELDKYLDTFNPILKKLNKKNSSDNLKLGGSMILKLYGLNFSRKIEDLDVIITMPSKSQIDYLENLKFFNLLDNKNYNYKQKNYKFEKNNLILNILIVDILNPIITVERSSFIYYKHKNNLYKLVSIREILDAKKMYNRKKDKDDLILLKNENFNICV